MPAGRDQLKPMQRLMRLMARLDQAGSVGASRDELFAVADYGAGDPGTQLNRDLKHLVDQGWQIDNVADAGETGRYVMVSGDNRLRLRLTPTELAAVQRAVIGADRADLAARLGVAAGSLPPEVGTAVVPRAAGEAMTHSLHAVQLRSIIRFSYKGSERAVHPAAVRFQNLTWYLSGTEKIETGAEGEGEGDVTKHFVIDRMSRTRLDPPGSADPVAEAGRIALHPLQWEVDEPVDVVVRADADYVPDVERWLMSPEVAVPGDGWVDLTYQVTNRAAFRARLYVLGPRVRVVGPAEFRAELLDELRDLVGD